MTEEEIVRALRCISTVCNATDRNCPECGYFRKWCDVGRISTDAADAIERLTAENAALRDGDARVIETLRKEIEWKDMVISLAQKKQAEAEAERDALIKQIKERHDCMDCKHNDYCEFDDANVFDCMNCVKEGCPCAGCCDSSRWEWRGLPEAPEEGEKA